MWGFLCLLTGQRKAPSTQDRAMPGDGVCRGETAQQCPQALAKVRAEVVWAGNVLKAAAFQSKLCLHFQSWWQRARLSQVPTSAFLCGCLHPSSTGNAVLRQCHKGTCRLGRRCRTRSHFFLWYFSPLPSTRHLCQEAASASCPSPIKAWSSCRPPHPVFLGLLLGSQVRAGYRELIQGSKSPERPALQPEHGNPASPARPNWVRARSHHMGRAWQWLKGGPQKSISDPQEAAKAGGGGND